MTQEDDTARLKFIADNLNLASVHIAIRQGKGKVEMYARASDWVELPHNDKFDLDDLRLLIDHASAQAEERK